MFFDIQNALKPLASHQLVHLDISVIKTKTQKSNVCTDSRFLTEKKAQNINAPEATALEKGKSITLAFKKTPNLKYGFHSSRCSFQQKC